MDSSRVAREPSDKKQSALYQVVMVVALVAAAASAMIASFALARVFVGVYNESQANIAARQSAASSSASCSRAATSAPSSTVATSRPLVAPSPAVAQPSARASDGCHWPQTAALGALFALIFGGIAVLALNKLPSVERDCDRYGRHMLGLSYVLVVLGLCNAVGTGVVALNGWLTTSVATLLESANPTRTREAEERKAALEEKLHDLQKAQRASARKLTQLEADLEACKLEQTATQAVPAEPPNANGTTTPAANNPPTSPAKSDPCRAQAANVRAQRALFEEQSDPIADVQCEIEQAVQRCSDVRENSRLALFFVLALSTMMSLLGACFYVVNSVRLKRSALDQDALDWTPDYAEVETSDAASVVNAITTDKEVVSTRVEVEVPPSSGSAQAAPRVTTKTLVSKPAEVSESFDEHAFWSGAFFRVGEAVLFTFAFFWLIWTSDASAWIGWLPVLGLFVGMFVKTGETIVFRLGMRALAAAEAMLPSLGGSAGSTGGAAPPPEPKPDDGSKPPPAPKPDAKPAHPVNQPPG